MTLGVRLHKANRIIHPPLKQWEHQDPLSDVFLNPTSSISPSRNTQGNQREKPPCAGRAQGEPGEGLGREAGGETGKKMGEEDNDERSSCGSFNILKEI